METLNPPARSWPFNLKPPDPAPMRYHFGPIAKTGHFIWRRSTIASMGQALKAYRNYSIFNFAPPPFLASARETLKPYSNKWPFRLVPPGHCIFRRNAEDVQHLEAISFDSTWPSLLFGESDNPVAITGNSIRGPPALVSVRITLRSRSRNWPFD